MTLSTSDQLHAFVDDLERTLGTDVGYTLDCDSIILCGMGGSAITSDVVADLCSPTSRVPITVVRSPLLPSWVGRRTLAIISSYSGNTAETIEMYRRAVMKGCTIVVLTSGGILRSLAEGDGTHIMMIPEGLHPRHSIGYMIGYTLAIMNAAGCPDISDSIRSILPSLRSYRDMLEGDSSLARELAGRYLGHVPVICSDSRMKSVVFRWKTQFNENSKYIAFSNHIPEFIYRGMDSWSGYKGGNMALTVLTGIGDSASVADVISNLRDSGTDFMEIRLGGSSELEDMFRAIMLGDYISIYMADMRGIDSAEVKPVMLMKERLKGFDPGQ